MKKLYFIFGSIFIIILNSCYFNLRVNDPEFPEQPINMESINSNFDDYNTLPPYEFSDKIYFSSNRNSSGDNFDIIAANTKFTFHQYESKIGNSHESRLEDDFDIVYNKFNDLINTKYNELGPIHILNPDNSANDVFMFSNDKRGNYNIYYVKFINGDSVFMLNFLNTDKNEYYPTYHKESNSLFFCSDRDGNNFNIYQAFLDKDSLSFLDNLKLDSNDNINKLEILSSSNNDKCPFILENTIVFVSDREGDFDIYYSNYINKNWTIPQNIGNNINSENNEYRPILVKVDEFINDLLIFSSDRSGGKGGYDLYYVGTNIIK